MEEVVLKVKGMMCRGCENRVEVSLKNIEGVEEVIADHNEEKVTVKTSKEVSKEVLENKIEDIGYEVVKD